MRANKTNFIIFIFLLLLALATDVCSYFDLFHLRYIIITGSITHIAPVFLIAALGSFVHSRYVRILYFLLGVMCIGAMLTVVHWPYGRILILITLMGIPVVYTSYFISKTQKTILDTTKLVYIVLLYMAIAFRFYHLPYAILLQVASFIFFYVLLILFLLQFYKQLQIIPEA